MVPGRYGQIEWHCDGADCHSCRIPGTFLLAAYTDRPRMFAKLLVVPGVVRHQIGDFEIRVVFRPEVLPQVAKLLKARRRRRSLSPAEARRRGFKPTVRATWRDQEARSLTAKMDTPATASTASKSS
jgi:hypothetical protein